MEYIDDIKEKGLLYDFTKICKEYNKLKCPKDFYAPTHNPFDICKWFIDLSDRSTGKTTGWILFGMIMNQMYGTVIQYIRQKSDFIAPKITIHLFDTIKSCNYIEKITKGKWNDVVYKSRAWYFASRDENGEIVDRAESNFMYMLSVDKSEDIKSGYNSPFGDLILFDEFIGKYYTQNEFVYFCDIVKTILRDRLSPIIVMLANTINKESEYFNELEIREKVQGMRIGDSEIITTDKGTKIFVELLGIINKRKEKRDVVNRKFFGFKNPALAAITGYDWSVSNYQHIPKGDAKIIIPNFYIFHNDKYVRLDIVTNKELGICVYCHWSTKTYDDSIIFTISGITDARHVHKLGFNNFHKKLWKLYKENKFFYATNDVGSFIENYLNNASRLT